MDGAIPPEAKRREEAGTEEIWAGEAVLNFVLVSSYYYYYYAGQPQVFLCTLYMPGVDGGPPAESAEKGLPIRLGCH